MSRVEQIVRKLENYLKNKDVLEAACGCAEFSITASKLAKSIKCNDLDDFRLNPEIYACSNVTFEKMDAAATAYNEESFDTVIIYNALAHLKTVLPKVLQESCRILKKDGHMCIVSSFGIDKIVINELLLPLLSEFPLRSELSADKTFVYVIIPK